MVVICLAVPDGVLQVLQSLLLWSSAAWVAAGRSGIVVVAVVWSRSDIALCGWGVYQEWSDEGCDA